MVTREEATKMRKELIRAERILAQKERTETNQVDFTPVSFPEKNKPEPKTNEIPDTVYLPSSKRVTKWRKV